MARRTEQRAKRDAQRDGATTNTRCPHAHKSTSYRFDGTVERCTTTCDDCGRTVRQWTNR
jgi:hypothetical protein